MFVSEWDRLEEELALLAVGQAMPLNCAIGTVCRQNTQASAQSLLLAAISVATQIDANTPGLSDVNDHTLLAHYKAVAALTADVIGLSDAKATCADLATLWQQTGDRVFLA